mmetsp:Transcript_41326/g.76377  ORF Transcript_41326/g.76377 Transcript_41326/m.76377 type:complete len:202 (-) Transcript_41326:324-929(-)
MKVALIGKVLGRSEGKTGRNDTLNGWVIGKVQEECRTLHGTGLLEVSTEETGSLHVDTHRTEHNSKVLLVTVNGVLLLDKRGLTTNLGSDLVVGKTGCRENGNLLPTSNGVHHINGRDTGLDHGLGVVTGGWVDGLPVDVEVGLSKNLRSIVNDLARAIERPTKHLLGHAHLKNIARELAMCLSVVNARSSLEHLHDCTVS